MDILATYPQFVRERFKLFPTEVETILHGCIGIAGEVGEWAGATTKIHAVEELGDLEFYVEATFQALGFDSTQYERSASGFFNSLLFVEKACIPLDLIKKSWVYNKPLQREAIVGALIRICSDLEQIYYINGWSRVAVLQANTSKLVKRFPTGYTDAAAQARADKQEGQ